MRSIRNGAHARVSLKLQCVLTDPRVGGREATTLLLCLLFLTAMIPVSMANEVVEIPLDANGLPQWEIRIYDDFPVRILLGSPAELENLLARVPLADFHREQLAVVFDSPVSFHLEIEPRITASEAAALSEAGYEFQRLPDLEQRTRREIEASWADQAERATMGVKSVTPTDIFYYPTHSEVGQILDNVATDHPSIASNFVWGYSVQNRQLWGIVISDSVGTEEAEPEVRLSSSMHGNEPPGMVMLLNLVEYLTDNYGQPGYEDVTNLVDNYEIHILPLHNPDGYIAGSRYNINGVDLNRNFPVPDGSIGDDGTWTEEMETILFKNYGFQHDFVISQNIHAGALVVNYPWDYTYTLAPDDDALIQLSLEYSTYNLPMYNGPFSQGITNGAQWYVTRGCLQDWSYHETGCIDVTLEVSSTHWPSESLLDNLWDDNRESYMHWIAAARYGVNGLVTGSDSGLPLGATVTVAGIDKPVQSDPDFGDYYKLLDSGSYDITFQAEGYVEQTITGVSTTWGTPTVLDVVLDPVPPIENVTLFSDDFESGTDQWAGGWGLAVPAEGYDSANSLTDSPGAGVDYPSFADNPSAMVGSVDLGTALAGDLNFWAKWEIESSWDGCWLQISTDGGNTWTALATEYTGPASGQGAQLPAGHPIFDGNQYSWVQNSVDLAPWLGETDVHFRFHLVSDSSTNRDGFYYDDFIITVSRPTISDVETPPEPPALALAAFPNPFNPRTTLRFTVGQAGMVELDIYDMRGRRVRRLLSRPYPAGEHSQLWDGRDDGGIDLPSGVYFGRVQSKNLVQSVKMTLVR